MERNVLVLDDDDDVREALSELIESLGAQCFKARTVQEMITQREPVLSCDLAVLDINLGYGRPSGIDAYRWLHGEHFRGVVVFLTGHARSHPLVAEACRLRDARVLEKPVGVWTLEQVLQGTPP